MSRHRLPLVLVVGLVVASCAGGPAPAAPAAGAADTASAGPVAVPSAAPSATSSVATGPAEVPTDRLLPVDSAARAWVDSALAALDTRGLAAQLVFPWMWGRYVAAAGDEAFRLRGWVEAGVGGIITSIGPPVALADKLNRLQRWADLPLLIAADLENGPGMRIQGGTLLPYGVDMGGGTTFPPAMGLGATDDPSLAYEMGRVTAAEARAVGIHLNFAPVVDVNNNPSNPIINTRSYGGDPAAVSAFAVAQVEGLQDHGVLATAKHFPGHGDVEHDTHLVPLILRIDAERADRVELVPYRAVIRAGVAGVMSAHIAFPALAGDSTLPATLSRRMLDSLLVRELGFDGLVITDALDMGAIVQRFGAGEAAVRALEAGADLLLQPVDPLIAIDAVVAAVDSGRIARARLERSVRKILEAKARVGLHRRRTVDVARVADVVGAPQHMEVAEAAAERSITLARDRDGLLPLVPLRTRVLLVTYTDAIAPFAGRALARELAAEVPSVERLTLGPGTPPPSVLDSMRARADSADLVVVAVDARVRAGAGAGAIDAATADAIRGVAARRPLAMVSLGNPYLMQGLPEVGTYLLGWSGADVSQRAVARALVGRRPVAGALPIAIPPSLDRGGGLERSAIAHGRAPPGTFDDAALDSLAGAIEIAIAAGVTPGAVVAVGTSRGGVWVRPFGRTDRTADAPAVTDSTVYDLASLTKVVGTTSAVMRLVDDGRMALDAPLSRYLPAWPPGDWRDRVTVRRLLTHRAGLPPFVRFWHPSQGGLRGDSAIIAAISELPPTYPPGSRYVYSDLGFILLGAAVEAVTGTPLAAFLDSELWTPLGMGDTGFNPTGPLPALPGPGPVGLDTAARPVIPDGAAPDPAGGDTARAGWSHVHRIAPTEVDTVYRHTHVHGQVHDENAWAMGGVAGHAGLFSTAPDLARFAHTLLRAGRAGDARVLGPGVVAEFTARQQGTDRALGWDARDPAPGDTASDTTAVSPTVPAAGIDAPFSPSSFGHTGFTGTSLWIDPERDLYVILLTNRVNPTRAQGGITALRRAVHEWAVQAVADRASGGVRR